MKLLRVFIVVLTVLFLSYNDGYCTKIHATNLSKIRLIETSLSDFKEDVGRYPSNVESLKVLIEKTDIKGWRGPYLPNNIAILDSWDKKFVYLYPSKYGNKKFDLYSTGKNLRDDTGDLDDITNWKGYDKWAYERKELLRKYFIRIFLFISILSFVIYRYRKIGSGSVV